MQVLSLTPKDMNGSIRLLGTVADGVTTMDVGFAAAAVQAMNAGKLAVKDVIHVTGFTRSLVGDKHKLMILQHEVVGKHEGEDLAVAAEQPAQKRAAHAPAAHPGMAQHAPVSPSECASVSRRCCAGPWCLP